MSRSLPRPLVSILLSSLPLAAQEFAVKQLDASPRHHEWVDVAAGARKVRCFVAFPEREEKVMAVVVIHENRGLTDWVRSFCDQLAAAGHLAIAPDLLSQFDAAHADTASFESSDAARKAIYQLDATQVRRDLDAVVEHSRTIPAANGRVACVGFCWGGARAFELATAERLGVACVFYGSPPEDPVLAAIRAPVFGFYGRSDQRINATIEATAARMKELGKRYEPEIYDDAGHAFMRQGDDPEATPALKAAHDRALQRLLEVLKGADQGTPAAAPAAEPTGK
ncbi:MAG: dienelactone hydrolase family protein [Planctomycetota bacterium]